MIRVKAVHESLVDSITFSGYVVDTIVPFVGLPSERALGRFVHIRNPKNGKVVYAIVLDIGPLNEHDDTYVFGGARPVAENGIELSERVWRDLDMRDGGEVEWEFLP